MHARTGLGLLVFAVACGPDVRSTSATLTDTDGNSGEGDDGDGDGASAEGNSACPELGPAYEAWIDALDRTEIALDELEAEIAAVESQLALLLGLPADAANDEIVAALASLYAASLEGTPVLHGGTTRCTGSITAARENLAICLPDTDVASILFDCEGACGVASPSACPSGVASCRDATTVSVCAGACTGECVLEAASTCDGVCTGECDGPCQCTTDGGECMGACEGMCMGSCEIVEAQCAGQCAGECESVLDACDAGDWVCLDEGMYCSQDCDSWAIPGEGSVLCPETAALAGAASMTCSPPFVILSYAREPSTCLDFAATASELESPAARLLQARAHLQALGAAEAVFTNAFSDYVALFDGEVEPCVIEAIMAAVDRLTEAGQRLSDDGSTVAALLDAIAEQPG